MHHILMKTFGPYLGLIILAVIGIMIAAGAPSCSTPAGNARVVALSNLGLGIAASQGIIAPGDAIVIGQGVALLTSEADQRSKLVMLGTLGLNEAVNKGMLSDGDTVLIKDAVNALVIPAKDAAVMTEPELPEGTSAKNPRNVFLPPPGQ